MPQDAPPKIFLTGPPGCGKTTLIRSVARAFAPGATGFYTEEVRDAAGRRIGFDLVDLEGRRAALARAGSRSPHCVGRYGVFPGPLEGWALDLLEPTAGRPLVVLDEVGKMECLSRAFRERVQGLLTSGCPVLATVARTGPGLIQGIHDSPATECWTVTPENREKLEALLRERFEPWVGP